MKTKTDTYEKITNRMLDLMEDSNLAPWRKTWKGGCEDAATSMATGKHYNGCNAFLLTFMQAVHGYGTPFWGTYKQIKAHGGQIRKGERSECAIYWNFIEKMDPETGKERKVGFLKSFNVFNADQADWEDGMPEKFGDSDPANDAWDGMTENEIAEAMMNGYLDREEVTLTHGGSLACYEPKLDMIRMPKMRDFEGEGEYWSTLFHEIGHSTGHEARLNRPGVTDFEGFGSHSYSEEELVAEFTACFLCTESGIVDTRENSAAYLKSWAKVLKANPKMLVRAAGRAAKAAEFVKDGKKQEVSA